MAAETLKCPMCGASASTDSTQCSHCGSRLATVACPSCFGMMFLGAKFCSHCGAKGARREIAEDAPHPCPRCNTETTAVLIGKSHLRECPKCEGLWADTDSLNQICSDREQQAVILGTAAQVPTPLDVPLEVVRYLRCPACAELMHRVNFARCSHVVVDVCRAHGTWFDRDELRRIIEFIRGGGLDKARAMEMRELERQRRTLESTKIEARTASGWSDGGGSFSRYDGVEAGIWAAAQMLKIFLR